MPATIRIPANLQAAITRLISVKSKPYLAPAIYSLTFVERAINGRSPAAVDSSWRCYYDMSIMGGWSPEAIAAVIEHEVWHLLRKHHRRAQVCNVKNSSVAKIWNYAADMEIHSDSQIPEAIKKAGFEPWVAEGTESSWKDKKQEWQDKYAAFLSFFQSGAGDKLRRQMKIRLTDEEMARNAATKETGIKITDMPPEWLCEWYFAEALEIIEKTEGKGGGGEGGDEGYPEGEGEGEGGDGEDEDEEEGEGEGEGEGEDDGEGGQGGDAGGVDPDYNQSGSGSDGLPKPWEDDPTNRYVDKAREAYITKEVAEKVKRASQAGTGVGNSIIKWANDLLDPKADWREVLNQTISSYIHAISGSYEYTRRKPSRRQGDRDYIVPGMQQPIPDISVVLDTSGSMMWGDRLTTAMTEIRGILEAFGNSIEVRVYATDAAVHSVERVYDVDSINALGGGGTDMGVGIYAAAEDTPTPSIIICVTDGETSWPDVAPPDVDVFIVALVSNPGSGNMPPSWVTEVVLAFD